MCCHVPGSAWRLIHTSLNASEQQELQARMEKRQMKDFMAVRVLNQYATSDSTLIFCLPDVLETGRQVLR